MMNEPNKITVTLKVVVTGEFYDAEASEETLRYCVEQDLEDAGFDVNVELLKEQEPRVLTLEEVQNDCPDYVYLEWHGCCICCIKDEDESDKSAGYFVYGLDGDYFRFLWNTYGVIWRCWTAMPTGKQIKAVKWNE